MHPLFVVFIAYLIPSLAYVAWILWISRSDASKASRRHESQFPSFGQRVAQLAKGPVVVSAAFTALCTIGILLWQIGYGFKTGEWEAFTVSDVFQAAHIYIPRRYNMASFSPSQNSRFDAQTVMEWVLDLPAIVPLVVVTLLIALFYIWLARIAEKHSPQ